MNQVDAELIFLGSGGAFADTAQGHTNACLNINGENLLIDFGINSHHVWRMELGKTYKDIDAIFCSHVHADHACFEPIFFYNYFFPKLDAQNSRQKLKLYCAPEVLTELWKSLAPSMESYRNEILHISNFADCHACSKFTWQGVNFTLVKNPHIRSSFMEKAAFGLKFTINGKNIYWSSDSATLNEDHVKWADIVFHDCETIKGRSQVHVHYESIKRAQVDRSKIYLMHYNLDHNYLAEKDGFAGFVTKGQSFKF